MKIKTEDANDAIDRLVTLTAAVSQPPVGGNAGTSRNFPRGAILRVEDYYAEGGEVLTLDCADYAGKVATLDADLLEFAQTLPPVCGINSTNASRAWRKKGTDVYVGDRHVASCGGNGTCPPHTAEENNAYAEFIVEACNAREIALGVL